MEKSREDARKEAPKGRHGVESAHVVIFQGAWTP